MIAWSVTNIPATCDRCEKKPDRVITIVGDKGRVYLGFACATHWNENAPGKIDAVLRGLQRIRGFLELYVFEPRR